MPSNQSKKQPNQPKRPWPPGVLTSAEQMSEAHRAYLEELAEAGPPTEWEPLDDAWLDEDLVAHGRYRSLQHVVVEDVPLTVATTWADVGGRLEPVEVCVSTPNRPVLGDLIRRIGFGTLQRQARAVAAVQAAHAAPWGAPPRGGVPRDALERIGHRGRATTADEHEEVARVYLEAWGVGLPVTAAVAEHFHVAPSTAAKKIMRARKARPDLFDRAKRITR